MLRFFREWTPKMPDELTTMFAFLTAPPEPFVPEWLQHKPAVAILACYAGPVEDGLQAVQPLKDEGNAAVDMIGPMPYVILQQLFDVTVPWGLQNYDKSEYLAELSDGLISALADGASKAQSPFAGIHIHHLGGAVTREVGGPTALGRRDAPYNVNLINTWPNPAENEQQVRWVRNVWQSIQPFKSEGAYINFMDGDDQSRVQAAYGSNYQRLAVIKAKYDPENLFRLNQNIKPA